MRESCTSGSERGKPRKGLTYLPKNNLKSTTEAIDVSKRIGVGKGIIEDPTDFDKWDEEIADLFEDIKK